MERRRRSSVAVRITLSLAVLALALTAVIVGVLGVFEHGSTSAPCPAARVSAPPAGSRPCVERAG
jgi:hypothetical protein